MKPDISKLIFWDTNYDRIDWRGKAGYVIQRVLSHGNLNDWQAIVEYYGPDEIRKVAVSARHLDPKTLSFLSSYFDIPKESFRCYKLKPSHLRHSPF